MHKNEVPRHIPFAAAQVRDRQQIENLTQDLVRHVLHLCRLTKQSSLTVFAQMPSTQMLYLYPMRAHKVWHWLNLFAWLSRNCASR